MGYTFNSSPVLQPANLRGATQYTPVVNDDNGGVTAGTLDTIVPLAINAGVLRIDCQKATAFAITMDQNITSIIFEHPPKAGKLQGITLFLKGDGTVRSINWGASVRFPGATVPALTGTVDLIDVFTLSTYSNGSDWLASLAEKGA